MVEAVGAGQARRTVAQGEVTTLSLDAVRARGALNCGVNTNAPGFTTIDSRGDYQGMVADLCRGLAAGIFSDATKVRWVPLTFATRFTALTAGEVDVLMLTSTHTVLRDSTLGLRFTANYFYDGHGFMAARATNAANVAALAGASICLLQGTTTEGITAEYFRSRNLAFTPVLFADQDQVVRALAAGRCDAYSTDASQLAGLRASFPNPAEHVILDDIISKEPHSPVVRHGDDQWFDIIRWTFFALLTAEELGITQANVESFLTSQNPEIRRLLGMAGDHGPMMGLDRRWAYNAIRAVGTYGEIFERNLGSGSPIGLQRGLNGLWTRGGLMYAPPIR
jgi:general L-amino acid transport system substrate-binding protein